MQYDSSFLDFIADSYAFTSDTEIKANLFKPCATFTVGQALNDPSNSDPNIKLNRYGFVANRYGSNMKPTSDTFPNGKPFSAQTYLHTARADNTDGKVYFTFGCDATPHDSYYGLSGNLYYQCALSCDGSFAPYVIQSTKTPLTAGWVMFNNKSALPGSGTYEVLNAMHEWMKSNNGKVITVYLKVGDQNSETVYYG